MFMMLFTSMTSIKTRFPRYLKTYSQQLNKIALFIKLMTNGLLLKVIRLKNTNMTLKHTKPYIVYCRIFLSSFLVLLEQY